VVHYPFYDLFYLTLPFKKVKPTLITIHDVIPLLYPKHYPKGIKGTIKHFIQTASLSNVSNIVTDSNCSTNDVIKFLKQPERKVKTVYIAPDPEFAPATKNQIELVVKKYRLDKPYFLYVGDINYNKNLPGLLKAFSNFKQQFLLVMVSRPLFRENQAAEFLWKEIDQLGIEANLRILTEVPQSPLDEMKSLYSHASWYIQPSFYEGFGLPVLEAQLCGAPVISSIGGSLKEIAGNSCLEFNPLDDQALTHTIDLALSLDNSKRINLIERGFTNTARFSLNKMCTEMRKVYQECINS